MVDVDQRINSVVYVKVLGEPRKFLLSVRPGKATRGKGKKSPTSARGNRALDLRTWSALPTELRGQTGASFVGDE